MVEKLRSEKMKKMAKEMEISLAKIYKALEIPRPVDDALAEKIAAVTTIDETKELFDSLPHWESFPTRYKKDKVGGRAILEKLYELYLQKFATVDTVAEAMDIYRNDVRMRTSTSMGCGEGADDIEIRTILARWCELVTTLEEAKELYLDTHPDYPEEQAVIRKIASMYGIVRTLEEAKEPYLDTGETAAMCGIDRLIFG